MLDGEEDVRGRGGGQRERSRLEGEGEEEVRGRGGC
jgi:hypothetical protein